MMRAALKIVVAIALTFSSACALPRVGEDAAAPHYLYLGASSVFSIPAGGGTPTTLVSQALGRGFVNDGIALDRARGHIYWTNMGSAAGDDGTIMRADRDGTNVVTIVPPGGAFTPKQLKIDERAGKLYWSDREGMAIMRADLDGANIETLVSTGDPAVHEGEEARWCVGIALDVERRQVYWTQKGGENAGEGMIRRASMTMPAGATASNRRDIETLFSRLPEPIDLDLDLSSRTIYWTDRGDNTVSRAPMDPPRGFDPAKRLDQQVLVRGLNEAIGVALDLKRGRMAYTSLGGEVGDAALDGSGARMLATGQGLLTGIMLVE
ncbi:MAG: 3-hydroxyacyl-CoA dehydrogenase [Alphaproteobacteria bacterium]|nr:3-hydroxyacyl-CoA dehydrogenase [Alphaproteobacteria bacterium]